MDPQQCGQPIWQSRKEQPMEKRQSLQQMVLGTLDGNVQKNETGPLSYTKINSKWMKDLNVRQKIIKILEEKTGNNLWPWVQQLLTRHVSGGKRNKSKNELLGPHQDKKLLHSKGNSQQNEEATDGMEKIFANDVSDKGLVSKIYKELIKLNTQKQIIQWRNGQKTWIDTSPKKTSRWPTDTWKDAPHHSFLGK